MTDNRPLDPNDRPLIEVRNLTKYFPITRGFWQRKVGEVKAVDGLSFEIRQGETLGLVGESGCGKSTTGRAILRLYPLTAGSVAFAGIDLSALKPAQLRPLRRRMQMIFQDPYASLNPRMTVSAIIAAPLRIHRIGNARERQARVRELLDLVGLNPGFANRFPHEFSGGQRQRIGIARALALNPEFIVCDEPIAALDVSIQAQVVNLLMDLQARLGLTYLFIAHDLSMVRHISNRVAVMYLGKIVELTGSREMVAAPLHPYTQALLSAAPIPNPRLERSRQRIVLQGDLPSPANPPAGCNFSTRCPLAQEICARVEPDFKSVTPGHAVACHLVS
ncbi:MAG: ATP-binding cassette domain-containing protein [Caldilineales bacterium]|nr:ATP-binding cassette domain-containing protein [Caldilineales bacterium]MCW5860028.1 ATP-binding cassette domain-containing protein [Caldilineales bacterium]